MKKIFTLFAIIMMASSMAFASGKINFHLTGCTSNVSNPTSYTEDDEGGIELYFTPEEGYTLDDWEITVKHGSTVIPNNNWTSPIGYTFPDASRGYLFIIWFEEITEDFDVTITCKKDAPAELVATPSKTEFRSLTDLEGMTITFTGETLTLEDDPYAVFLVDEGITTIFAQCTYSFANNVLTINSLTEIAPLPEEETDIVIFASELFVGYYDLAACTIHYNPNATPTALENIATDAKSSKTSKLLKDGKLVIVKNGKKFNVAGQKM